MRKTSPNTKKIQQLEIAIGKQKVKLAALRRKAKPELIKDYTLTTTEGRKAKLSSLFGKHQELILIHNMGQKCSYCTLWADGFKGIAPHLQQRAAFVLESPDAPKDLKAFAKSRGWDYPLISSQGTSLRSDLGFADEKSNVWPGVSVLVKSGKSIKRVSKSFFGPGDNFCIAWDFIDLLPKGANGWAPKKKY